MTAIDPASVRLVAPCTELVGAYVQAQQPNGHEALPQPIAESLAKTIMQIVKLAADTWRDQRYWMAAGDAVIGRVTLRPKIDVHAPVTVDHIGYEVFPAFRGCGFGHRAVALGMDELRRQGIGDLLLICEADNSAAIKILETAGGMLERIEPHPDFPARMIRRYRIKEISAAPSPPLSEA
ncbi:MAG: GNAT family N-acetyltransferase [Methylovirgula sp.]